MAAENLSTAEKQPWRAALEQHRPSGVSFNAIFRAAGITTKGREYTLRRTRYPSVVLLARLAAACGVGAGRFIEDVLRAGGDLPGSLADVAIAERANAARVARARAVARPVRKRFRVYG